MARGCDGKHAYKTQGRATRALKGLIIRKGNKQRGKFGAYKCRECEAWHIGHNKPKPRSAKHRKTLVNSRSN